MLAFLLAALLMPSPTLVKTTIRLAPPHRELLTATERFVDAEGAIRSAKTWTALIKQRRTIEQYPGIAMALSRWTDDGLHQILIPDYRKVCELLHVSPGEWNTRESCYDFPNKSRAYCVHLKTNQTQNRYMHIRGLTVAQFYIDQLEEVPEDVYDEAALRLSQPGYPQQMVVTPNPVAESHWIAKRWPSDPKKAKPDHRYIRLALRDNAHNLDPATIAAAERLYPVGHPLRRVKLEGKRGMDVSGTPVYSAAFNRERHVAQEEIKINPQLPLCEAYDYGFHHPCVLWYQYAPWGHLRILGGCMGSDLHLDAFLPIVERYRAQWFPNRLRLEATCDPAGANENAQGLRGTPVGILRDWYHQHGERDSRGQSVGPVFRPDANTPERRYAATELGATYMRRQVNSQEAFLVDPERWRLVGEDEERYDSFFIDGLEAGYVLEDTPRHSSRLGSFWVPKKDGWFEHPMNCFEYGLQVHVMDLPLSKERADKALVRHETDRAREEARKLKEAQKDHGPDDRPKGRRVLGGRLLMRRRGR